MKSCWLLSWNFWKFLGFLEPGLSQLGILRTFQSKFTVRIHTSYSQEFQNPFRKGKMLIAMYLSNLVNTRSLWHRQDLFPLFSSQNQHQRRMFKKHKIFISLIMKFRSLHDKNFNFWILKNDLKTLKMFANVLRICLLL